MFSTFLDKQFNSVVTSLDTFTEKQDPENIHDIRVSIKKLRAVLSFLRKAGGEEFLPKKILGGLFNDAGELREAQMNIKLLEQYDQTEQIIKALREREKELAKLFILKIPEHIIEVKRYRQQINLSNEDPAEKQVKKYFDKIIKKCEALLSGKLDPENLHHLRMLIKKLMYLFDSLPEELARSIGFNVKYIERLQKKAGDWHDAFVIVQFIHRENTSPGSLLGKLKNNETKMLNSFLGFCKHFEKKIYA